MMPDSARYLLKKSLFAYISQLRKSTSRSCNVWNLVIFGINQLFGKRCNYVRIRFLLLIFCFFEDVYLIFNVIKCKFILVFKDYNYLKFICNYPNLCEILKFTTLKLYRFPLLMRSHSWFL